MNSIKKAICLFVFTGIAMNFLAAQDENASSFSLTQLIDNALQKNYLLQANKKNTLIKEAEIDRIKTQYQPSISTSASFSVWKFLMPNKERLLGGSITDFYNDIALQQTIYDWGLNKAERGLVEDEIRMNDEIIRQLRHTIIYGVTDTYFEAIKAKAEIAVYQNALQQLESHLRYSQKLFDIGKVSSVDVLKTRVQISEEKKALQKSENHLDRELARLKRLCYIDDLVSIEVEDVPEDLYLARNEQLFPAEALYDKAIQDHPELKIVQHELNIEGRQKELYRLENRPDLFAYGLASWEHGYVPFVDNFNYNIGVGIRYTLPIGKGSAYKSKILQSELRTEKIHDEREQSLVDIKKDIDLAINTINDIKVK
ncbi:MAG: TolC family protein [Bacteroidales bacterium]|nr:TolC family protein [Bacteroidales bacterium]